MPSVEDTEAGRKRRAHTKSRNGCKNCKLRRVKVRCLSFRIHTSYTLAKQSCQCDEGQPSCQKCVAYGVDCNYGGGTTTTELHHSGEAAFIVETFGPKGTSEVTTEAIAVDELARTTVPPAFGPTAPPTPPSEYIMNMLGYRLALHETDEVYVCTERDLERLRRFHDRTVLTIGTAQTVHIYRDSILMLGWHHDYVTHIVFTITLMHDRYLSEDPWQPPTTEETFHHYHGTAMFNKMLSKPLEHSEKDAMWAAAALLGAITIAAVDAKTPEESWPLKEDDPNDLDWLRMSDGKKEVWRLANPMREDSIWRPALSYEFDKDPTPQARRPELDCLFPFLERLYNYDSASPNTEDPYHTATSIIVRLLPIQCTHSTILYFLAFIGHMEPHFKDMLHQKDDKALLLLAWWYAKMLDYPAWWHQRRAMLECKAICIYLGRRYVPYTDIGRLLDYPKMMCGFAVSGQFMREVDQARSANI
jgi:hypothetical protein